MREQVKFLPIWLVIAVAVELLPDKQDVRYPLEVYQYRADLEREEAKAKNLQ